MKTKETAESLSCLQRFLPLSQKLDIISTDNSKEFIEACQGLQWNHDTCTFIAQKRTEWQKGPSAE